MTPKNWKDFQHYKDRKPPWIKLHRGLLDDYAFSRLPLASQALAPRLWLLSSEYENGNITADLEEMAFRLHLTVDELSNALQPLINSGFFIDDSKALASCKQETRLEREEEIETQVETEGEERESSALRAPPTPPIVRRETKKRAKARAPLPDLWAISEVERAYAKDRGFADGQIASMATAFENHHRAKGSLMADWTAAWRTWCENEIKFNRGNGNGFGGSRPLQNAGNSNSGSVVDASDRLIEKLRAFDEPAPSDLRSGEGQASLRLISKG